MRNSWFIGAAAALITVGCATTAGNAPTSSVSGFDGGRVVNISGHGLACKTMVCSGLGAQWSSKSPQSAIVTVYLFNDIKGITGASLSVDGQVTSLRAVNLTNFSRPGDAVKQSRADFVVPLQLVRSITTAQKAWLRVQTTDGYVEDAIVDGPTDSKALHALKRFLAEVGTT